MNIVAKKLDLLRKLQIITLNGLGVIIKYISLIRSLKIQDKGLLSFSSISKIAKRNMLCRTLYICLALGIVSLNTMASEERLPAERDEARINRTKASGGMACLIPFGTAVEEYATEDGIGVVSLNSYAEGSQFCLFQPPRGGQRLFR